MLTPDEVTEIVGNLWTRHQSEVMAHDRAYEYVRGRRGVPEVPSGAGDELQDLAKMSVKNVLSIVVDSFAQNLSVNGFRSAESEVDDPVWDLWQAQRMDARQAEAHRAALTYGSAYVVVAPDGEFRVRTPRQMLAVYRDPSVDEWPVYALETWIENVGNDRRRRGVLYDAEHFYEVDLGQLPRAEMAGERSFTQRPSARFVGEPIPHNAGVCPVVRFVNMRDAEDVVVGEVAPLLSLQRAINAVNFDRLVVSRYGAFPQRYVIGWAPSGPAELTKASMAHLMAFDETDVKVGNFAAAGVEAYNSILEEMVTHVAMEAQIPLAAFGRMVNLSAEALAMAEAPHQRKLAEKRESFGESWEQVLRLAASLEGVEVSDDAEVLWRDSETRSFAQVIDGISKLHAAGVPIEELLQDIPGWSKQRVDSAKAAIRRAAGAVTLQALLSAPPAAVEDDGGAGGPGAA